MIALILAASALAATPNLTIRRDCDAAGGLPSAKAPLTVAYSGANGKLAGRTTLGTLVETTAKTKFDVEYDVDVSGTERSFALTAHSATGDIVAEAVVDVYMDTGEVLDASGDGFTTGRIRLNDDGSIRSVLDLGRGLLAQVDVWTKPETKAAKLQKDGD